MDEARLLAHGDHQAFQKFFRLYAPRVFRYALTPVRDEFLAEEVVQEMMIAVGRGAKDFRGRSQVSTWVFGIARNQAWQVLRRTPQSLPEDEELPGEATGVEDEERVRKALEKLPRAESGDPYPRPRSSLGGTSRRSVSGRLPSFRRARAFPSLCPGPEPLGRSP